MAPEGATEIIKCHDDFEDDDSLVLTESSYFQRMQFDTSLDLRLWSDSLGRMLLLVGYSLHDINTRYLLSIAGALEEFASCRPAAEFVHLDAGEDEAQETVLRSTGVLPIPIANGDPGGATRRLCGNCWRRFAGRRAHARSGRDGTGD